MLTNNSLLSLFFKKINGHEAVFSLEITAALLMKFLLLAGIWWVFFAGNKQPVDGAIYRRQNFWRNTFCRPNTKEPGETRVIANEIVELSRLQFALTALYHFLFVSLTLGLLFLLAIMESVYGISDKPIYKDMTRFWGKLFGINFAMGVAIGITLEFQFGTNWAYYSHYVGDVFGPLLAIESMMAFFLESTFVGLFFFGWERLSKIQHLVVTWLLAWGASLSALWILIVNGWMQHPVGAEVNYDTMRMELASIADLFFNTIAQVKFVHCLIHVIWPTERGDHDHRLCH